MRRLEYFCRQSLPTLLFSRFLDAEIYLGNFRPVELVEHIAVDRTVLEVNVDENLSAERLPLIPDHVATMLNKQNQK